MRLFGEALEIGDGSELLDQAEASGGVSSAGGDGGGNGGRSQGLGPRLLGSIGCGSGEGGAFEAGPTAMGMGLPQSAHLA